MNLWQAVLLGIVQGLTEFLPVSSSGHLVLVQHFLGFAEPQLLFDVTVHFATLFAVAIFFFPVLIKLRLKEWFIIGVGTIPAVIVGLFLKDFIESLFAAEVFVAAALMVTGIINLASDRILDSREKKLVEGEAKAKVKDDARVSSVTNITWKSALFVGTAQALAITPGISRSGSTLLAGLSRNFDRQTAFTFSFLLALPAISGATLLQIKDVWDTGTLALPWEILVVGGIAAFCSGYASLWVFKKIVTSAKMQVFGWYCLVAGAVSLLLI